MLQLAIDTLWNRGSSVASVDRKATSWGTARKKPHYAFSANKIMTLCDAHCPTSASTATPEVMSDSPAAQRPATASASTATSTHTLLWNAHWFGGSTGSGPRRRLSLSRLYIATSVANKAISAMTVETRRCSSATPPSNLTQMSPKDSPKHTSNPLTRRYYHYNNNNWGLSAFFKKKQLNVSCRVNGKGW